MCAAVPLRRFLARRRRALWPRRARWSRNEKQQKRARLRRMQQHIERARGRGCERGRSRVERRRAPSRVILSFGVAREPARPRSRAAPRRTAPQQPRSTFSRALQARDRGLTINSRGGRDCSRRRARSRRRRRYQPRARTRARHSPTDAAMPSARTCAGGSWTPWSPPFSSSSRSAGKARRGGATAQRWAARGGRGAAPETSARAQSRRRRAARPLTTGTITERRCPQESGRQAAPAVGTARVEEKAPAARPAQRTCSVVRRRRMARVFFSRSCFGICAHSGCGGRAGA